MNISKTVRMAFTIIGLITVVLAVSLFFTNLNEVPPVIENIDSQNTIQPTFDDFLINSDNVSFEELKKQNSDLTKSTVIQNSEDRKRFVETVLKNREPVIHDVLILPEGISSRAMIIAQGDLIKFSNELNRSLQIDNLSILDTEEKSVIIESKDFRTYGFDFLGEFDFEVDGTEFKVFVQKNVE
ncbi:MAG: hypothetical protein QG570_174 [Patescibacteria group bacterium]|nr:hypothetical protein [Patescibacteria group bacterium]